jgi:ribosomal protein S18 acetylase RimI-like enzyme
MRDDDDVLTGVGAVERMHDGTGHLRGVTVRPAYEGRGLGRALSAALTRLAIVPTGVATLGVYTDNARAIGLYTSLGYGVAHTFTSGEVLGT